MKGELRLQVPVYPLDGNDGAQIASLVNDIRRIIPSVYTDLAVYVYLLLLLIIAS